MMYARVEGDLLDPKIWLPDLNSNKGNYDTLFKDGYPKKPLPAFGQHIPM